jgi:flagellar biosynthesis component FlhA
MSIYIGPLVSSFGTQAYAESKLSGNLDIALIQSQRTQNHRGDAEMAGKVSSLLSSASSGLGLVAIAAAPFGLHPAGRATVILAGVGAAVAAHLANMAAKEQAEQEKKAAEAQKKADEERRTYAEEKRKNQEFRDKFHRENYGIDRTYGGKASALDAGDRHSNVC